MAKKRIEEQEQEQESETTRIRQKMEYRLQFVHESGNVEDKGLIMSFPSEAVKVRDWLNEQAMKGEIDPGTGTYRFSRVDVL